MRKYIRVILSVFVFILAAGCGANKNELPDVFQYKGSYIGDASALGNIVSELPSNDKFQKMELQTKEEPYGAILTYDIYTLDLNAKFMVLYNTMYIFALIPNAEWMTYEFNEESVTIHKEKLVGWIGNDLSQFTNSDQLHSFAQRALRNETVINQFFE